MQTTEQTEALKTAQEIMYKLHDGVQCSDNLVVSEQVQGTVNKIKTFYNGENKDVILQAAYLHKAMETKCLNPNILKDEKSPYNCMRIKKVFGSKVAQIVSEIASEPSDEKRNGSFYSPLDVAVARWRDRNPEWQDDDLKNKEFEWMTLADWAKGLSKEAQVVLLAEKLQNFEVSRDNLNMKKTMTWYKEYYKTRMFMCEAIADASPELYKQCQRVQQEGLNKLNQKQAALLIDQLISKEAKTDTY